MRKTQNNHTRRYRKISVFLFFVAVTFLFWSLLSMASSDAQPSTEPLPVSRLETSTLQSAALEASTVSAISNQGDKMVSLFYAHFFIDMRIEGGVKNMQSRKNMVKRALVYFLSRMEPSMVSGDFDRMLVHEIYPMLLEKILEDTAVVDQIFARSLLVEYQLQNIAPQDVYSNFRVPSRKEVYDALQIMIEEGYRKGSMLRTVKAYKAKHDILYKD
uniref:Uncharacterized protein n=1 Tax=Roseihalotalea indica TaxID=2867963 RepID=A0AA49GIP2_9BACT|nr:hypothetical protein K4G66_18495 [Tunicatimonas sp. TK19036]